VLLNSSQGFEVFGGNDWRRECCDLAGGRSRLQVLLHGGSGAEKSHEGEGRHPGNAVELFGR
jgi:hypothetical protein